jgi:molybdenum cofactor cytidylyltransferase
MKEQTVDVKDSAGRILCSTIFRPGGRKLLSKGHVLSAEDVRMLETEGLDQVPVSVLEEGEVGEDDAVCQVSRELGCGCLEIRLAAGGRANLFTTEDCCVLVDEDLLKQINCISSLVIATSGNFTLAPCGTRAATVKSAPFAVPGLHLETIVNILREGGPILQARPIRNPTVAVLYTDPVQPERARQLFEGVMRQRLERYSAPPAFVLAAMEEEAALARSLDHLMRARPTVVLIASTTAPAGPSDAIGRAMTRLGCHIERFLAPVEPGNLLILGYKDEIPVISAPGCFRSAKPNVIDLVLPPLLARYRVSGWEIASLGHGGLLA